MLNRGTVGCLAAVALLFCAGSAAAQEASLGRIEFPTSGKPEAQAHFLRGVAALHSFWFEEALEAFRASTQADPSFAMGYWGEAMAHNHPLWAEQDTEAARAVLAKIPDTSTLTVRERGYIEAVRVLYGEGDKAARDTAFAAAMEKLYRDYPGDLEAASFYSLSLLGSVRPENKGFRKQVRAGAIALDVFAKNPQHPGAAHYIIHAFDDPEHAILALPAAYRYAAIAPEAHHARHMPSHIFLQLGMWPEAAASNESSWAASVVWVERKKLPGTLRDFHSLHWLFYVYLQQGRYAKAEEVLALRRKTLAESAETDESMPTRMNSRYYADMLAELVVETDRWDRVGELFPAGEGSAAKRGSGAEHGAHAAHSGAQSAARGRMLAAFLRGLAAAQKGSAEAAKCAAELREIRSQLSGDGDSYRRKLAEILELEVTALASAAKGNVDAAREQMRRAVHLEEEMAPPSGPPDLIKPSHELFGEILLRAGRPQEAAAQFATALQRQPNRARSLLGAARAAARSGDHAAAAAAYEKLLRVWEQADAQIAELREARDYVKQAAARAGK